MDAKPGDKVLVEKKDGKVEGTLMPGFEKGEKNIVLKLKSGYNIGIDKSKIKSLKVVKPLSKKHAKHEEIKKKPGLPKITILHTGGTIASKIDYNTGGVVASFKPEDILSMIPELADIANIDGCLVANIMSENIRFSHYNLLAKDIEKQIKKGVKGIIITHGTDTMHYTAAALSFILENLSIPVLLVGSQRSSDRGSSDGAINILSAAYFIAKSDFIGVAICMHENPNDENCLVLPGTKTRKMHTSRRDTFRPINTTPIARVNFKKKKIELIDKEYGDTKTEKAKGNKKPLKLRLMNEKIKIGLLKIKPNLFPEEVSAYKGFDGLVIEGTGMGNAPVLVTDEQTRENSKIADELKKLCKQTIVVMAPQTIYGRIQMNVYATGRELQNIGVLGNYSDMTPETTYIKLAWLLSNYNKKDDVKKLMLENLSGELTERTLKETFLI